MAEELNSLAICGVQPEKEPGAKGTVM